MFHTQQGRSSSKEVLEGEAGQITSLTLIFCHQDHPGKGIPPGYGKPDAVKSDKPMFSFNEIKARFCVHTHLHAPMQSYNARRLAYSPSDEASPTAPVPLAPTAKTSGTTRASIACQNCKRIKRKVILSSVPSTSRCEQCQPHEESS